MIQSVFSETLPRFLYGKEAAIKNGLSNKLDDLFVSRREFEIESFREIGPEEVAEILLRFPLAWRVDDSWQFANFRAGRSAIAGILSRSCKLAFVGR